MKLKYLFMSLLIITTSAFAQTNDGTGGADFQKWQNRLNADPKDALAYFNLGVLYQKNHKSRLAVEHWNKAIELKSPLAPVATYYKSLVYFKSGQKDTAKTIISTLDIQSLPTNLRQEVTEYKNSLFAEENPAPQEAVPAQPSPEDKRFSFYVDVSGGQNDNPATVSDTTSASNLAADTQSLLKLSAGYLISASDHDDWRLGYSYSYTAFANDFAYNYYYHQLTLAYSYFWSTYRIKLTPEFFTDNFGSASYSQSDGATLDFSDKIGEDYYGFSYRYSGISNLTSSYYYLTGFQAKVSAYYDLRDGNNRWLFSLARNVYSYQDGVYLVSGYTSYPVSVTYSYYLNAWEFTFSLSAEPKSYAQTVYYAASRSDTKWSEYLHIGYNINQSFSTYAEVYLSQNSSTFGNAGTYGNYNYQQDTYTAGLAYGY